MLVVLDDLHWANVPSLGLLRAVVRELRDAPVLVIGASRDLDVERDRERTELVADVAREGRRLELRGLPLAGP